MKARNWWRSALVSAAVLSAFGLAACTGSVGDSAPSAPTSPAQGGSGSGASGASTGSPAGDAMAANSGGGGSLPPIMTTGNPVPESAGILVMRRLTYREYAHTLADLIGSTTDPTTAWSPDVTGEHGFVAPTNVADLQVQLYEQTANTLAEAALAAGKLSIPCHNPAASAEAACATQFANAFGLRAYRRPLAASEQVDLMTLFTTVRGLGLNFNESIAALAKAMIQSPNFLYHWEIGPTKPVVGADGLVALTPWQVASRLASSLWETMPDDALLQAAQAGQLSTPSQLATQVQRMFADPRASQALFDFHQQWLLNVGSRVGDLTQVSKSSPVFTPAAAAGLVTEFTQFLSSVYATGDGTLNTLFTAPYAYVNKDLAAIYGVSGPATGFAKVSLDPTQRAGILTQTAFLASHANDSVDNPIFRGLAIYNKVLCGVINPPGIPVPGVAFMPGGTTRQSYTVHASKPCAVGCHSFFDPPGFAFENYDGLGVYRTMEGGQAVDSSGTFTTPSGGTMTVKNAVDLGKQLAQSPEAQVCIDRQWTRFLFGRLETAADEGSLEIAYRAAAAKPGFSVRDMLTALAASKAYLYRQPSVGEPL